MPEAVTNAIERTSPPQPAVRNEDARRDEDRPTPAQTPPPRPAHDPHKGALVDVFA